MFKPVRLARASFVLVSFIGICFGLHVGGCFASHPVVDAGFGDQIKADEFVLDAAASRRPCSAPVLTADASATSDVSGVMSGIGAAGVPGGARGTQESPRFIDFPTGNRTISVQVPLDGTYTDFVRWPAGTRWLVNTPSNGAKVVLDFLGQPEARLVTTGTNMKHVVPTRNPIIRFCLDNPSEVDDPVWVTCSYESMSPSQHQ